MATVSGIISIQTLDADGVKDSIDTPFKTTSGLLSDIQTWANGLQTALDSVIGAAQKKVVVTLDLAMAGGLKTTPNSGSVQEQTALINWTVANSINTYGYDVPGASGAVFNGSTLIVSAGTPGLALETYLSTVANTTIATDRYGNSLVTANSGKKTFRKKRRALARA